MQRVWPQFGKRPPQFLLDSIRGMEEAPAIDAQPLGAEAPFLPEQVVVFEKRILFVIQKPPADQAEVRYELLIAHRPAVTPQFAAPGVQPHPRNVVVLANTVPIASQTDPKDMPQNTVAGTQCRPVPIGNAQAQPATVGTRMRSQAHGRRRSPLKRLLLFRFGPGAALRLPLPGILGSKLRRRLGLLGYTLDLRFLRFR